MENGADRWQESNPNSVASLTIVVVSADPIVAIGLRSILEPTGARLEFVGSFGQAIDLILGSASLPDPLVVLVYLSNGLDVLLFQQLQRRTPPVPVLAMGQGDPPPPLPGLSLLWGLCPPDRLRDALGQLAQGQGVWWGDGAVQTTSMTLGTSVTSPRLESANSPTDTPRDWLQRRLYQACLRGSALVQGELQQIQTTLQSIPQTWLDRQILQGQQRELQLVQWLLQKGLLPQGLSPLEQSPQDISALAPALPPESDPGVILGDSTSVNLSSANLTSVNLSSAPPLAPGDLSLPPHLENLLFDRLTAKLATPLRNLTPLPLEIDGLNLHKRQELLLLVVQCFGDRLTELRHSGLTSAQLGEQQQEILEDLWTETITRFFGQYTIVTLQGQAVPLVPRLLSYREPVRSSILHKIPLWSTVVQTVLFQEAVLVDGSPYRYDSPEALNRLEQLFENLVLQVANGVVQPLLNECSKVELIKQTYFHPRLLSTRQIERFRNDLSWKYRVLQSFEEPRNIYESRFVLLVIQPDGIHRLGIYAPRQGELEGLNLWQQSVTLGLEFRDAAAPRLQALTRWLGQGVVYLLTQILGKAIGLIGRGIVQGLGSVWSDRNIPR